MLETSCVVVNSEVSECWALHECVRRLYPLSKEVLILPLSPASIAGADLIIKYQLLFPGAITGCYYESNPSQNFYNGSLLLLLQNTLTVICI